MAEIIAKEKVAVVTTGAGNPSKYIDRWKDCGIRVFPVVPSPALAIRMERYGVDGIICEGTESGGHIGEMTTMTLVVQVADKVKIPVIAAGGIASGKQMLAAEVLGAVGVQMGTIFLGTKECPIHPDFQEKILRSKDNHVTVIGRAGGIPIRLLKNNMTNEYLKLERTTDDKMELEKYTIGALRRAVKEGDVTNGSLMCGQVVGQVNELKSVETMLEDVYREYLKERTNVCLDQK